MNIELGSFIGLAGVLSGIIIGWIGVHRTSKKSIQEDTVAHAQLKSDVSYIKNGVDDIRLDFKAQEIRVTDLSNAVIRIDESTKSAHKRIDKIEDLK